MSLLTIHVEQLEEGKHDLIDLSLPPDFLDVSEEELAFKSPVTVKGKASVITGHLILELSVATEAEMPCSICNKNILVTLANPQISHTIPLIELPSTLFDYTELLREEILVLVPQFAECKEGKCPERGSLNKYMGKQESDPNQHFPFADL